MSFGPYMVETAIARVEGVRDASARDAALQAVTAVLEFHREGMRRLLGLLRDVSPEGENILRTMADDELVGSLLSLHGVHPLSVESRVRRALGNAPGLQNDKAGRVDVISIDESTIRLRVDGSEQLRNAVQRAVEDAVPDVGRVEVVGRASDLIPIKRLLGNRHGGHERCKLCGEELGSSHSHLFDVERRRLTCACSACSVLLGSNAKSFRRVRRKAIRLDDFRITDAQWKALKVPVGLAFFSHSSMLDAVVAAYPGPAGAVESTVTPATWEVIVRENSALAKLDSDTEALLVDRRDAGSRYYILSIDECFRLTGLMRSCWTGLTGGDGPARAIDEFFAGLTEERS